MPGVLPLVVVGSQEGCVESPIDVDGDGWPDQIDCDDTNDDIHEATPEVCNGKDDNCDGYIDEDVNFTYYLDADGDTYGTAGTSIFSCEPTAPEGYTDNALDYDDLDESVNILTWYEDGDGDGYGDAESFVTSEQTGSFDMPEGYVENNDDCNDTDYDANIDKTWYHDADGDGYGDPSDSLESCLRPDGYVTNSDDWNDSDATVYPGAPEICDDQDNDGDGYVDDEDSDLDTTTASTWYADADADGYGNAGATKLACDQPEGYVDNDLDDDDADDTVYPDAPEICDGKDNDGNGLTDDEDSDLDTSTASTWYADADGDGYGDAGTTQLACDQPLNYVSNDLDADDADDTVYPGAPEICDDKDNDGNGLTDDEDSGLDTSTATAWYYDGDLDGYGDDATVLLACAQPEGYISTGGDDDDANADIYPGAPEICDGEDNNSNGLTDDEDPGLDTSTALTWYYDGDNDGYGDAAISQLACDQPLDYVSNDLDEDDGDDNVYPGAPEICDDKDNDGNGLIDDEDSSLDTSTASTWYYDGDGDGYGTPDDVVYACDQPTDYVSNDLDHADDDPDSYYGAPEICDDADNDGDGLVDTDDPDIDLSTTSTFYADADGDGYGDAAASQEACEPPDGYVTNDYDYDDSDNAVNILTWYRDADGDGYGVAGTTTTSDVTGSFSTPSGYADNANDCDDTSAAISPAATEDYTNGIDDNCDGTIDDEDGDGYTISDGDCDDTDPDLNPGTVDTSLDGVSENCDDEDFYAENITTTFTGDAGDSLGAESTLAEVNSDGAGVNDLVLGIPDSDLGGSGSGAVAVFRGENASDFLGYDTSVYDGDIVWYGAAGAALGFPVADPGDVDGRGHSGVLVGAAGVNSVYGVLGSGTLYTTSGSSISSVANFTLTGLTPTALAGDDHDGDGYSDIFVGESSTDSVYLYEGPSPSSQDVTLTGSGSTGHEISVGDIDGDGYSDLLIAAPDYDGTLTGSTLTDSGRVYLHLGPHSDGAPNDLAYFIWEGDSSGDGLGEKIKIIPDTDGDGALDIVLTAPHATDGSYEGAAYLFDGATAAAGGTALASDAGTILWANGDGLEATAAGDFTDDNLAEFCASANQNSDYASQSGQVYCVDPTAITGTNYLDSILGITRVYGSSSNGLLGEFIFVDPTDNGTRDLLMGATGEGSGGTVFLLTE